MLSWLPSRMHARLARVALCASIAVCTAMLLPAASDAAVSTFGSPLAVPATLDTTSNLGYEGVNTPVPPAPDAPDGNVHTSHNGVDTALWNVAIPGGVPVAPAAGQVRKVELEGCAVPNPEGPAPLTQIHFQSLAPTPGGVKVTSTSQAFDIPVCGVAGASGATISSYEPASLCVAQGEYVAFNDEGGYVERSYRSGAPYRVMATVAGATFDSFVGGASNGAELSSSNRTSLDGFAANPNAELLLRATLGTGADALQGCGGAGNVAPSVRPRAVLPSVKIAPQTDGINQRGVVSVAMYCRLKPQCQGTASLSIPKGTTVRRRTSGGHGHRTVSIAGTYGKTAFKIPGGKTSHIRVHVSSKLIKLARRPGGVSIVLTALVAGQPATGKITVKV
jgi:hypothetical protein